MKKGAVKRKRTKKTEILVRENGDVVLTHPPEFFTPELRDSVLAVRSLGKRGIPLHDDEAALKDRDAEAVEQVLGDHGLLAVVLLEAIHAGDHGALRTIADVLAQDAKPRCLERTPLTTAVIRAARRAGREPTEEAVAAALVEVERERTGAQSPNGGMIDRSDKLHDALVRAGFHLRKEVKRGDHLRKRKSPI